MNPSPVVKVGTVRYITLSVNTETVKLVYKCTKEIYSQSYVIFFHFLKSKMMLYRSNEHEILDELKVFTTIYLYM